MAEAGAQGRIAGHTSWLKICFCMRITALFIAASGVLRAATWLQVCA